MAGEPRDIIAAALAKRWDVAPSAWLDASADAVLAALTDAGITLCRRYENDETPPAGTLLGDFMRMAVYVPVEDTP